MRIENGMEKVILTKEEAITLRDAYDIISDICDDAENDDLIDITDNLKDVFDTFLFSNNEGYRVYYEELNKINTKKVILQMSINI